MKKDELLAAIKQAKASQKRNFTQSVDLIVSFKDLDLKKPAHQFELFVKLPHDTGTPKKMCCVIGPELDAQKGACDHTIEMDAAQRLSKKDIKKLAKENDFFVAQGNLMAQVAKIFGRYLGPRNKMPNPKAGCVVSPASNLKVLKDNLQRTVRIGVKTVPLFQCKVGNHESKDEDIADNVLALYDQIIHHLPNEMHNVKSVFVKVTMGPAIKVGAEEKSAETPKKPAEKQTPEKATEATKKEAPAESAAKKAEGAA